MRALFDSRAVPVARAPRERVLVRVLASGRFAGAVPTAPRAAGAMQQAATACACETVRLAPGELVRGGAMAELTAGRAAVETLTRLGGAAAVPGSRDFAWPLETLRRRMAESRFPWLGANLVDSATGRRPDWIAPYHIVAAEGVRIAVVGYVSAAAEPVMRAAGTRGLHLVEGAAGLRDALAAVATERPDVTIILAHADATCDALGCRGEPVARLKLPLRRDPGGPSPLADLAADAQRNVLRTDAAVVLATAPAADLAAGPVPYADVLAVYPSSTPPLRVTLGGRDLRDVLEQILAGARPSASIAGLVVHWDPRRAPGRRLRDARWIGGGKIRTDAYCPLAVSEAAYRSAELSRLGGLTAEPGAAGELDAFVTYLARLAQPVVPPEGARFVEVR